MMNFSDNELKTIYESVRYYQMNKVALDGKMYRDCDEILNKLFPIVKVNYVEPAYRVDS